MYIYICMYMYKHIYKLDKLENCGRLLCMECNKILVPRKEFFSTFTSCATAAPRSGIYTSMQPLLTIRRECGIPCELMVSGSNYCRVCVWVNVWLREGQVTSVGSPPLVWMTQSFDVVSVWWKGKCLECHCLERCDYYSTGIITIKPLPLCKLHLEHTQKT